LGEFAVNGTNVLARASDELTPEYQLPTDREIEVQSFLVNAQ
jgi:hypothetical protein